MNREPKRWLDDDNAPAGVRDLLRGSRLAVKRGDDPMQLWRSAIDKL